jgi:hypothetical protein
MTGVLPIEHYIMTSVVGGLLFDFDILGGPGRGEVGAYLRFSTARVNLDAKAHYGTGRAHVTQPCEAFLVSS